METENKSGAGAKPPTNTERKEAKTYTAGDLWTYGGIGALITGIIGYFIGQSQGEKKAKRQYEHAVNEWRSKTENLSGNDNTQNETPKFRLE